VDDGLVVKVGWRTTSWFLWKRAGMIVKDGWFGRISIKLLEETDELRDRWRSRRRRGPCQ
jgi:hypothetical protein